jgi:serine protease
MNRTLLGTVLLAASGLAAAGPAAVGGYLVEWREGVAAAAPAGLRDASQLTGRWQRLQPLQPLDAAQAAQAEARLRADLRVTAVVPDVREQRQAVTPSDRRFGEQWWLQARAAGNTGAADFASAWMRSTGAPVSGPVATVAVLDSGITSHPELNARILPGWDFVSDTTYSRDGDGRDNDPSDPGDAVTAADRAANPTAFGGCAEQPLSSWHGTIIAGQVAALSNNGEGVAAANWNGTVLPVRVAGQCGASVGDIVDGLRWAAGLAVPGVPANPNPARLIVLSYGSLEVCDADSPTPAVRDTARLYRAALAEVRAAGALVMVAAGNQRGAVARPANCAGAFAVAALNREGFKSSYSNFGAEIRLAAPGGDAAPGSTCDADIGDGGLVSTGNLGDVNPGAAGYAAASGTSFAAPQVAATAAMMLALNPALTVAELETGLTVTAAPFVQVPLFGDCGAGGAASHCTCTVSTCGGGQLDADQALAWAVAPSAWTAPVRGAVTLRDDRIEACAVKLGRAVTPVEPPAEPPAEEPSTGGGLASPAWLLGLAAAAAVLRRRSDR